MVLINLLENPIEIINPSNSLPGIAPFMAEHDDAGGGHGGLGGGTYEPGVNKPWKPWP